MTSEMCCILGEYFYQQKEFAEGISWYQYALDTMPCMDIHCCGDKALFAIAEGFVALGEMEQAEQWKRMAEQWTPPEES